jgi:outer membrane receptor protein involved in Fe transport
MKKKSILLLIALSIAKKAIVLLIILLFSNSGASQTLKGKIIGENAQPVEFATAAVKSQTNNFFSGTAASANGTFVIENLPADTYLFTASFTGYSTFEKIIIIKKNDKLIDLNQIVLKENAQVLQEVEVTGTRGQMRFELDRKIFDVDQNIASAGGSASDILQNIPSVEVGSEGEISLRGSSSVTVWINGKASGLTADNQAQILEQLPAETIERIEIITNPSAKYSPEGTAGIINIVLKESRKAGYYGSVQVGINSRLGYNANGSINYSSRKIDAYASTGFRSRALRRGGYSNRYYFNQQNDTLGFLNQTQNTSGRNNNLFARLGITYHITPKNHLSISGMGMFGKGNNTANVDYLSNLPNSFTESRRTAIEPNSMNGGSVQLGYKYDFGKESNLDFTASYNVWNRDGSGDFMQKSVYPTGDTISSLQRQKSNLKNQAIEIKADYVNVFKKIHKLEAGYQGNFNRTTNPRETKSGVSESSLTITPSLCNDFFYDRFINAIYITYSAKIKNFNLQTGLRGETTKTAVRSLNYGESLSAAAPFDTTYFNLFPSLFLSYSLPKENQIQINYTRRITRPSGRDINPFKNISDSTNISYGNPFLSPEYSNSFEINYIKMWEKHTFSLSGYFRNTDGVIQRIGYMDGGLMYSTSVNVAKSAAAGTELVLKNRLFKILNLTTTLNLYYFGISDFEYREVTPSIKGKGSDSFTWNVRMIANLTLPLGFSLQATGGYNAPQAIAQGTTRGSYSIDAGLRKKLKDFNFNLNMRDIFNSRSRSSRTLGEGFVQDAQNWWGGRTLTLTVAYNFGNMKTTPNKRNRNQQNSEEQADEDIL